MPATEVQHTPTPWFVFDNGHCIGGPFADPIQATAGVAMLGMRLRSPEVNAANTRLVVRAVNAHEKLVAFVRRVSLSPNVARHVADDAAGLLVEIGEWVTPNPLEDARCQTPATRST